MPSHTGDVATEPGGPPEDARHAVTFKVLGPLEVRRGGVDYAPTTPKILQLLTMLVIRPGKLVHLDSIVQELWPAEQPRSVRNTLHTYVHHLRRGIERDALAEDGESLLVTRAPGYLLRIEPDQVDVAAFGRLHRQGQEALRERRYADAARLLRGALDLWSGQPLENLRLGPTLSAYAVELRELRRSARQMRIEAEIHVGLHLEVLGELRSLVAGEPLDESLQSQLIRVLRRSGRRSDAMASYRRLRTRLNDELGVEPCDELQSLHRELLSEGEHRP